MGKDRRGVCQLDWLYSTTLNWNTSPPAIQPSFYGDCGLRSVTDCMCMRVRIDIRLHLYVRQGQGDVRNTWDEMQMVFRRSQWCVHVDYLLVQQIGADKQALGCEGSCSNYMPSVRLHGVFNSI